MNVSREPSTSLNPTCAQVLPPGKRTGIVEHHAARSVTMACCAVWIAVLGTCSPGWSAPVFGEKFKLRQPDGSFVEVRIWGDEFHQVVESLDGHTLIRDPSTGVISYGRLSADGKRLASSGTAVGREDPVRLGLPRHLRVVPEAAAEEAAVTRAALAPESAMPLAQPGDTGDPEPAGTSTGSVQGICLLVDFSDDPGTIAPSEIDNYCNQVGYQGFDNNGSVRDYFYDVSIHRLTYTNYVPAQYYRAIHPKPYYDDPDISYGVRARELIREALDALNASGFDFSQYDADLDGKIDAINCFYSGNTSCGWSKGLWPHSGTINFSADGVTSYRYQITNMSSSLKLSTFCHENGHMLCNWPDLYDYGLDSAGVGRFCLMCNMASDTNPVQPCAYLKYTAGWTDVTLLTTPQVSLPLTSGTNAIYKFAHPTLANEYYLVENRQGAGRDAALPDAGLALWHVDVSGSNNNQQMTPSLHYMVTLVQADGRWDLENSRNSGDSTDLWKSPTYVRCGPDTIPNTNWWSGAISSLGISQISAAGPTMYFTFGTSSIVLSTYEIERVIAPGETAADDAFTVANSNTATTMDYTVEYDPAWISVSPISGSSTGEPDTLNITYNNTIVSGWPRGTYSTTITVRAPSATNSPQALVVRIVVETVGPDFDGDEDVDQRDFGHLQACLSGISIPQTNPGCQDADLDHDGDVDPSDFNVLRGCFSGPGIAADRACDPY